MEKERNPNDSAKEAAGSTSPVKLTRNQKKMGMAEKMDKILDLTEMGASIRQISTRLGEQGFTGTSRSNIGKLLKKALDAQAKEVNLKAKHHVQIALSKMQRIELAHFTKLLSATEPDAIEKLSRALERVWKRQDALLGTTKPEKLEITGAGGGPIDTKIRVIMPAGIETIEPED